jgi:hypothetical protein
MLITSTLTAATRPYEIWHMDTFGPTKTKSLHGFYYNTTWKCGFSDYCLSYSHNFTTKFPEIQERWYADTARLRKLHGDPRVLSFDNASVNISASATSFREARGIHAETSCPYESHQMGTAERMNQKTLFSSFLVAYESHQMGTAERMNQKTLFSSFLVVDCHIVM